MTLFLVLLVLAVAAAAAAVATGRIGGAAGPVVTTHPHVGLAAVPPGEVRPQDVDAVRFSVGLRGYRMDEVDAVLARLREELR